MNILLTGASGFVGRHLSKRLGDGHKVHFLCRPHNESDTPGPNGDTFFFSGNNIQQLSEYLRDKRIDGVIHLASYYTQRHTVDEIPDLVQSNLYLGMALLEACKIAETRWFLNTGSIWQNYNSPDFLDLYCPVNLYAATKQAFITVAKFYVETTNIKFCTLKLCDTYGPGDTRPKVMSLFERIAKTGESLEMSPGEQKLDLLHIDDVVSGFIHLAEMLNNNEEVKDEYVLSSGRQITLKELANAFETNNNVELNIIWGGREYREREVMTPYKGNILDGWAPKTTIY